MAGQAGDEMGDDLRSVFDHRALVRLLDGAIARGCRGCSRVRDIGDF
jgi:hypothetical protein